VKLRKVSYRFPETYRFTSDESSYVAIDYDTSSHWNNHPQILHIQKNWWEVKTDFMANTS